MISDKIIGRLSLYRRLLNTLEAKGTDSVYSHGLAKIAGCTPAQVRRDIMSLGYSGSPAHGYRVVELLHAIRTFLDNPEGTNVALIGIGHLGRALLDYFVGRRPNLKIVASFDNNESKVNRVIHGVRCYPMAELEDVIRELSILVAIIAVPAAAAHDVAKQVVAAGVRGILNFAPIPIQAGPDIYVEDMDVTSSLEKVSYFAHKSAEVKEVSR